MDRFPPPHFFHIAEPLNLASIKHDGLLSAERLIRRTICGEKEVDELLGRHRHEPLVLGDGTIIRDQKPMPPGLLATALCDGMTPSDWYRLVNGFVFLWANEERFSRHLSAFQGRPQVILRFDARRLLADLGHLVFLSPINCGNARRKAVARSHKLFVPYRDWLHQGWPAMGSQHRPRFSLPAEVLIRDHLPLTPYLIDEHPTGSRSWA